MCVVYIRRFAGNDDEFADIVRVRAENCRFVAGIRLREVAIRCYAAYKTAFEHVLKQQNRLHDGGALEIFDGLLVKLRVYIIIAEPFYDIDIRRI